MNDEARLIVRKADVIEALQSYLNQKLFKLRMTVLDLIVSEDDDGEPVFEVKIDEEKPEVRSRDS